MREAAMAPYTLRMVHTFIDTSDQALASLTGIQWVGSATAGKGS